MFSYIFEKQFNKLRGQKIRHFLSALLSTEKWVVTFPQKNDMFGAKLLLITSERGFAKMFANN